MDMASVVIELKDINVKFSREEILREINLSIYKGESLVILGPSGQGKSVLLKTLAGLIAPHTGELLVNGKSWLKLDRKSQTQELKKMGILFQKNALFDSLTVFENVAFPLRENTELTESEIEKKVLFFLDAVGILHAKNLFPDEISGGMQKRLGIARALALEPEIIFYDDPTAGLDPITSRKIVDLIKDLKKKNKSTVIAVTNDVQRAYQLADRILMVVDKSVVITGSVEETKKNKDPRVHQFILGLLDGPLTGER